MAMHWDTYVYIMHSSYDEIVVNIKPGSPKSPLKCAVGNVDFLIAVICLWILFMRLNVLAIDIFRFQLLQYHIVIMFSRCKDLDMPELNMTMNIWCCIVADCGN